MKTQWLEEIELKLPKIINIVNKCEEKYREKCFELLLYHALNEDCSKATSNSHSPVEGHKVNESSKFGKFLEENALSRNLIENLIDLDTGDIVSTKLGSKNSDIIRNIAILLSVWHFSKQGEFLVERSELLEKSKKIGGFDHNYQRYMKGTSFEGKKVFLENGPNWKIPLTVRNYVAKVIKELNG